MAEQPSKIYLADKEPGVESVYQYLLKQFPHVSAQCWRQRMQQGKVHWQDGSLISEHCRYRHQACVYYYREVLNEKTVPFKESIVFQNENFLVADKPHFLPVTAGGRFVQQCLQNRLRKTTGNDQLQAVHRLDKDTAGLVLFSCRSSTRHSYHQLFDRYAQQSVIEKTYLGIAKVPSSELIKSKRWRVENCISASASATQPKFLSIRRISRILQVYRMYSGRAKQ